MELEISRNLIYEEAGRGLVILLTSERSSLRELPERSKWSL